MKDTLIASIATSHTKKIIISDPTKFRHYGSIPETMYRSVTAHSKVMADYRNLNPIEPRVLTTEQQAALDALDKPSNRGKRVTAKKETTEHETSKPSKSKKRNLETESSSKPKKIKRMARKPKGPTPPQSDNEDEEDESQHVSPRDNTPPHSPTPTQEVKIPTPSPSPKQTPPKQTPPTLTPKVPVSVVPTTTTETSLPPPPVSSISISTTPLSTPIITPVTSTTIPEQTTRVNVSHTGAPTSDEDTKAPINRQHLDSIHENLDTLLADTKAYGGVVLKAFVETSIAQYTKAMDNSTDAIKESTSVCKKSSADVTEG
ncbi:pollen-specific leucine-rich repeat extensin-like protein 1 [Lactuca sativa]|uniref:pollen-specific leucine-rich repeat extensin-like protein 1 n=1 Tax=Lactuca sativa TaxID=4236 RepID=UPI000CD87226|nr:pollen-specific leucine-rich repeat extensin-like protein 1 [Lactuca sativa]